MVYKYIVKGVKVGGMNLTKNSIPDDPHSCYSFLVDKDNVWSCGEDKKGLKNRLIG